ncbi:MAG TPA: aspartate/glutamate racemase family protein [Thermohalobaculum sp.]|nr:aspartate/glutamate racemase family protein [Thermohalobaculum sp.]
MPRSSLQHERQVRIGLVHATSLAVEPTLTAFHQHWMAAQLVSLIDESLQLDAANTNYDGPSFTQRILMLAEYQVANGAEALLFTCSAFSDAIKAAGRALDVPVLRPDEAAIEQALAIGQPVRVLCTFAPTVRVVQKLVAEFREDPALPVAFELVEGALEAIHAGNATRHDTLIAEAAARATEPVLVLSQYSMARAAELVEKQAGRAAITGPAHAVRMLRKLVETRGT